MQKRSLISKVVSGSLLIAGTAIGAGMLGIPLITAECGFWPASIITFLVYVFMTITGLLLLRATLWIEGPVSFLSLSKHFLGKGGEVATGIMFAFLYYCLMVAYFAGGSHLFISLFGFNLNRELVSVFFALIFFCIVLIGPKSIDRVNISLSILMFITWIILMWTGSSHVKIEHLSESHYSNMWLALPILFGAFGYHNVIPSLVTYLGRDRKALIASILIGTSIPLLVYFFWQWLIIGVIPLAGLREISSSGLPVTFALQSITSQRSIYIIGQLFALFAITTSILGVSFSLVDFLADGFKKDAKGKSRFGLTLLTFAPPLFLSMSYPKIFSKALSLAGGFGEAILNGILPILLVYVGIYMHKKNKDRMIPSSKAFLALLFLISLAVIAIEII